MSYHKHHQPKAVFLRDMAIVFFSCLMAVLLMQSGFIEWSLASLSGAVVLASFVAGIFFTSTFTVLPAMATFIALSQTESVLEIALFGAMGAVIGDLIIFLFVRDIISEDIALLTKSRSAKHAFRFFRTGFMRHFIPVIGALMIASPVPNELGISLLGLSHTKLKILIVISIVMNFIGIALVSAVGKVF